MEKCFPGRQVFLVQGGQIHAIYVHIYLQPINFPKILLHQAMQVNLGISGILLIMIALIHFYFPRYFNWKGELGSLSIINRQMMKIHTFFIALVVFLIGILCLTSSAELSGTKFGKRISLGLGIFWAIRLFVQFFGYSSKLWKGKSFETAVHILFALIWTYLSATFILVYLA